MPFTVDIIDKREFFLFSELKSVIESEEDDEDYEDNYITLTFYSKTKFYKDPFDGYIDSRIIYELAEEELISMKVSHLYKIDRNLSANLDVCIDIIYAMKEYSKKVMSKNELKLYKVNKLNVPIRRRKRKRGSNTKSSRNDLPTCKKSKLLE